MTQISNLFPQHHDLEISMVSISKSCVYLVSRPRSPEQHELLQGSGYLKIKIANLLITF